jgi:transposase
LWGLRPVDRRITGARELIRLGHEARMMLPAYVKPYVRRQKNDSADAAATYERGAAFDAVCRRALAGEPGDVDAS